MNRAGSTWLLIVFALLVAGSALFWFLRQGGTGPIDAGTPVIEQPDSGNATALQAAPDAGARKAREATAARSELQPTKPKAAADPDYEKHLAGFTGRVVTSESKPVPQCPVRMYLVDPAAMFALMPGPFGQQLADVEIDIGGTTTDAEGRFTLLGAEPRAFFGLVAGDGTLVPRTFQLVEISPSPGELVDLGDVKLRDTVTLKGKVVDPDDKPVEGALVRAFDLPGALLGLAPVERFDPEGWLIVRSQGSQKAAAVITMPAWVKTRFDQLPIPRARTDKDGNFTLIGVDVGTNTLAITYEGLVSFLNPSLRTKVGQDKDLGILKMKEGETAQGRVVDTFGKPVAGAEVMIAQTSTAMPVDFAGKTVTSDERGHFEKKGFASGSVTVAARRTSKEPWTIAASAPVAGDLVATLPTPAKLTIRIRSKTGARLDELRLQVSLRPPEPEMLASGFCPPVSLEGRVEEPAPDTRIVKDLPVGAYAVFVKAKDHAENSAFVLLERDQEVAVELQAEQKLVVRVVGPGDKPLRRATVCAQVQYQDQTYSEETRLRSMPRLAGTTDAAGKVEVTVPANAQSVTVSARHPAWGVVHARSNLPVAELVLVMVEPGSVDGILTEQGQVPKPGLWVVEVRRDWQEGSIWGPLPDLEAFARPDARGSFKLRGLRPGKYSATARKALDGVRSPGTFYEKVVKHSFMDWMERNNVTFEVDSARTTMVTVDTEAPPKAIDGPSALVTGVATIDGKPAEGMMVFGWTGRQVKSKVDQSGRFDLGAVSVGTVHLQLIDPRAENPWANQLWSGQIVVKENQPRELQIHVQLGSLEGMVQDPTGQPAANCDVQAAGSQVGPDAASEEHSWSHHQAKTDANGRFRFERVPAGTYSLTVRQGAEAKGSKANILVKPGALVGGIEIRMHKSFSASGKIDLAPLGGKRPEWLWCSFMKVLADGGMDGNEGSQIAEDGSFQVAGLANGAYEIHIYDGSGSWVGTERLVVQDQNLRDLSIKIARPKGQEAIIEEKKK